MLGPRMGTVVAAFPIDPVTGVAGLFGSGMSAFLLTVLLGGLALVVAPAYTERMVGSVGDDPAGCFVYGVATLVALVLLTIALVVTVLGVLLAIALVLLAVGLWGVGAAVAYTAIGDHLVGHEDGWFQPLVVGGAINGLLTMTGIGGIVAFIIGAVGFGALLRSLRG